MVRRGERGPALGHAAIPAERLEIERLLLGLLPSLCSRIGKVVVRKVDRLSCTRVDSARYSVPDVHIGRTVEVRVADGEVMVMLLGEIITTHKVIAPGETCMPAEHYGGGRPPSGGGAAQDRYRKGLLCHGARR